MDTTIESIIRGAADRFAASLAKFQPWKGKNAITERNLSFQFSKAFLERFPDGFAFMEVPFKSQETSRAHTHLDAYLYSAQLAVMLECKIVFQQAQIAEIVADMKRMTPALLRQIQAQHKDPAGRQSAPTICMVLAETWRLDNTEWWCGDTTKKPRWSRAALPGEAEGWNYGCHTVFRYNTGPEGTLYWLYAYSPVTV